MRLIPTLNLKGDFPSPPAPTVPLPPCTGACVLCLSVKHTHTQQTKQDKTKKLHYVLIYQASKGNWKNWVSLNVIINFYQFTIITILIYND